MTKGLKVYSVGLRITVAEFSGLKGFGSCSFCVGCRVRPSDRRTVSRFLSSCSAVVTEYIVGALGNARAVVGVPGRSWGGRSCGTAVLGPCNSTDASEDDRCRIIACGGRGKPPMVALEIWLYALWDESEVAIEPTEPFLARGSTA